MYRGGQKWAHSYLSGKKYTGYDYSNSFIKSVSHTHTCKSTVAHHRIFSGSDSTSPICLPSQHLIVCSTQSNNTRHTQKNHIGKEEIKLPYSQKTRYF